MDPAATGSFPAKPDLSATVSALKSAESGTTQNSNATSHGPAAEKSLASRLLLGKAKKALGNRLRHRWLRMDADGEVCEVTMGKAAMTHKLGVQPRDLRLLDALPHSSPPAILCRDKAIIINLEFLKCIITTDYVMIMNSGEERVDAFVQEHRRRLRDPEDWGTKDVKSDDVDGSSQPYALTGITEEAPFELRVLEVVLDFVTMFFEYLVTDLEQLAHPILDHIVQKVTMRRLDRLRSVKNRMVRLNTRVETVRELLEKLLNDDEDMRDMNLSAKVRNAVASEWRGKSVTPRQTRDQLQRASLSLYDKEEEHERDKDQVEQVLETFFLTLDNTWNRLQTLAEYVDDTEDYVKFEIDTQRNRFIEYRLLIQFVMVALFIMTNVFNIFTVNMAVVDSAGEVPGFRNSFTNFIVVTVVSLVGCSVLLFMLLAYCRYKRLLLW